MDPSPERGPGAAGPACVPQNPARRRVAAALGLGGAALALAPAAWARGGLPRMTEGPFYPSPDYRARALDWDADLTEVRRSGGASRALGEVLDLSGVIRDAQQRVIDGVQIEIWQCDVHGSYRHPNGAGAQVDAGFQGFGQTRSDAAGLFRFRTIRPVQYPGRTPHIHVKLRHPSFGERTSQWFVAGESRNAGDGLYRRLSPEERAEVDLNLRRADPGAAATWVAERSVTLG
jgi:protocatechuate 3,4-dioxygenase, beta subunit